ncbi:NUDIX domain-containing protein [Candidatus Roizmanbacteria bacterium]|nr:NUDIX domain-containing protein [Candidatus Roizmanbacteria bacterium]
MYDKYPIVLAVAAFIRDAKGRILIIKKSLNEQIDPGLWTVPGGKVMPEEPIVSALKREVNEEVGLLIDTFSWIGEDVFTSNDRFFHAQHFLCEKVKITPIKLEKNLTEYKWVLKNEVERFQFPPKIKKRLLNLL